MIAKLEWTLSNVQQPFLVPLNAEFQYTVYQDKNDLQKKAI